MGAFDTLLSEADLRLAEERLSALQDAGYFTDSVAAYVEALENACRQLRGEVGKHPSSTIGHVVQLIVSISEYLSGSTTKRTPYEVVYSLRTALKDWLDPGVPTPAIVTLLSSSVDFHFNSVSDQLAPVLSGLVGVNLPCSLVLVALPEMYRHRPLYCMPLYHELGHYIWESLSLDLASAQLEGKCAFNDYPLVNQGHPQIPTIERSHRGEYFADVFMAAYCGAAGEQSLKCFIGDNPVSPSHPSSASRLATIRAFLAGTPDARVVHFRAVVRDRFNGEDRLAGRFDLPNVRTAFEQIRPHPPQSQKELHGLFCAGWQFMEAVRTTPPERWLGVADRDREGVVNDLVEKSLRTYMIEEGWRSGMAVP